MLKRIYLDMDDVLLNTTPTIAKFHNLPDPYLNRDNWEKRGLHELLGLSFNDCWDIPWGVWAHIPKMPWADICIATAIEAVGEENVFILTSPIDGPDCAYGKQVWVERFLPSFQDRLIVTRAKYACVGPEGLLIDDAEHHEWDFEKHGLYNSFYLFPAYSNYKAQIVKEIEEEPKIIDLIIKSIIDTRNKKDL